MRFRNKIITSGIAMILASLAILGTGKVRACSFELSIAMAFQREEPLFSELVTKIDLTIMPLAISINLGKKIDFEIETIKPALEAFKKLLENYPDEKPPVFFYDRQRWKQYRRELTVLFERLENSFIRNDSQVFHDTVDGIEEILLELYTKRGKRDSRIVYGILRDYENKPETVSREELQFLKERVDKAVAALLPRNIREVVIKKKLKVISTLVDKLIEYRDRKDFSVFFKKILRDINRLENEILNLKWFARRENERR